MQVCFEIVLILTYSRPVCGSARAFGHTYGCDLSAGAMTHHSKTRWGAAAHAVALATIHKRSLDFFPRFVATCELYRLSRSSRRTLDKFDHRT
jgi:hypothetical protein